VLNGLIRWSLRNRLVVVVFAIILAVWGVRVALQTPLDVFPAFAPPQVVVQTEAAGFSASEVEQLITTPIELALNGTANLETVRSSSIAGLSVVTCIFQPATDIFRARQLVTEKLQQARARLPDGANEPQMMPVTSPIGIIYKISLTAPKTSLMDLRSIADWTLRPRLLAVPGVAQVIIYGGEVKQYQVITDPARLKDYGITLGEVMNAAAQANQNAAAGYLDTQGQTLPIRGEGRVHSLDDLANAVVAVKNSVPIRIRQVARVQFGAEYKVGDSSTAGKPSVLLLVMEQPSANTLEVSRRVETALKGLRPALPPDVTMDENIFRQATFIERAITNIREAMLQGGALVVLVLLVFLFSWRTGLVSLTAIPLSLLIAVLVLHAAGRTINTMTLGGLAIALGEVVDDAIVDVENVHRRLRENRLNPRPRSVFSIVFRASTEIRGSVVFATFIVALVFLPVFALSGLPGRIFAPLGEAYIAAILASLLVALTVTPALCSYLLPKAAEHPEDTATVRLLKRSYGRWLARMLRYPGRIVSVSLVLLAASVAAVPFLQGEFLPEFNEGNIIVHMAGVPGTSLAESLRAGAIVQRRLLEIPEVAKVAQRAGRAELGEDTFEGNYSELDVNLKESQRPREAILADVRSKLAGITGFAFSIKQFIAERIEEVLSGSTATVVVKLFGPDLDVLRQKGAEIRSIAAGVPGVADLNLEQQTARPQVLVRFNHDAMGQYGLNSAGLARTLRAAFYGATVSEVFEEQKLFAILVRYEPAAATDPRTMGETLVDTGSGAKVPLSAVADIEVVNAPSMINRENAQRRIVISSDIEGGSLTGVAQEIQKRVGARLRLPASYYVVYGGAYEAESSAVREILLLSAAAITGIFLLLFMAFRSAREAFLVMANLPLALIGGVAAVFLAGRGETSIASLVGFISLFGIATRNGIMLISHYHHLMRAESVPFGRELVERGALERLSPILMTALTAGLGLLPLAISAGKPGRELEQPMAVVILGGLLTSTLLNMIVLPALYLKFGRRWLPEEPLEEKALLSSDREGAVEW